MATIHAWIYPGQPACNAPQEYSDGRAIAVLKPQYFRLSDSGVLIELDANDPSVGCNGYSVANAADVKKYSAQQFVTISGATTGMDIIGASQSLTNTAIQQLIAFLAANGFTGIELDFEGFGGWTAPNYAHYKAFVTALGSALHSAGYHLMIDGPAIVDTTTQGNFKWKWEDFNTLPVDYLVVMAYDRQYDYGSGTPVAPLSWLTSVCNWMKSKVTDSTKIVIGLNSYGYHGATGGYHITIDTYAQSQNMPGFSTAKRDSASMEMMWTNAGISYNYSDSTTLDSKLQTVLSVGITNVSAWHLGGNLWFSKTVPAVPSQNPALPENPILAAFHAAYPGFDNWYSTHFDAQGNPRA